MALYFILDGIGVRDEFLLVEESAYYLIGIVVPSPSSAGSIKTFAPKIDLSIRNQ
jgi:hypothetical protein